MRRPDLAAALETAPSHRGEMSPQDRMTFALDVVWRLMLEYSGAAGAIVFMCSRKDPDRLKITGMKASGHGVDLPGLERLVNRAQVLSPAMLGLAAPQNKSLSDALVASGWLESPTTRLVCLGLATGSAPPIGGAILAFDKGLPEFEDGILEELSEFGGLFLQGATHRGSKAPADPWLGVISFFADVFWEANAAGEVTRVHPLVARGGEVRAALLEGQALRSFLPGPNSQTANPSFRDRRLEFSDRTGARVTLELSGQWHSDSARWMGMARVSDRRGSDRDGVQIARGLSDKLDRARLDEAQMREEAELLLDGLRILTRPGSSRDTFGALLELLKAPLGFQAAAILQREWNGQVQACEGVGVDLESIDWAMRTKALFDSSEPAQVLGSSPGRRGDFADLGWSSALVVRLGGTAKPVILVCFHSDPNFFGQRHMGLGLRLSLIASQALLTEEERQKVVQASKMASVGEVAAGLAHEVNQPLTAMSLAAQNIEMQLESGKFDKDRIMSKVERISSGIDRIAKIVKSMRVLARRSDGDSSRFSVRDAIDEAIAIVHHRLRDENVALEVRVPAKLDARGNQIEFSQVVLNVIANSADAIKSETAQTSATKERRIEIESHTDAQQALVICIRDTGPGFPAGLLDKVMQPFFTTKEIGQGTGLGLSLCKRMMTNMRGDIAVGNWSGGAEIRLTLTTA